jgi:hypothetical protein
MQSITLLQHKDNFQAFKTEFFSKPNKKIRILKAYGKQDFSSSMPSKIKLMLKENPPRSCAMYNHSLACPTTPSKKPQHQPFLP